MREDNIQKPDNHRLKRRPRLKETTAKQTATSAEVKRPPKDPKDDPEIKKIFENIRGRRMRGHELIAQNGHEILKLKRLLKERKQFKGYFGPLLKEELGISTSTADNWCRYAQTWDRLEDAGKIQILGKIEPTFIYRLTAPSVHEDGLKEALGKVEKGEDLDDEMITDNVARHKIKEQTQGASNKKGHGKSKSGKAAKATGKVTKSKSSKDKKGATKTSVSTQVEELKAVLFGAEQRIEKASNEVIEGIRVWAHENLGHLQALFTPPESQVADSSAPKGSTDG